MPLYVGHLRISIQNLTVGLTHITNILNQQTLCKTIINQKFAIIIALSHMSNPTIKPLLHCIAFFFFSCNTEKTTIYTAKQTYIRHETKKTKKTNNIQPTQKTIFFMFILSSFDFIQKIKTVKNVKNKNKT